MGITWCCPTSSDYSPIDDLETSVILQICGRQAVIEHLINMWKVHYKVEASEEENEWCVMYEFSCMKNAKGCAKMMKHYLDYDPVMRYYKVEMLFFEVVRLSH